MVMEMEPKERLVRGTGNERITITAIDQQSYGLTKKSISGDGIFRDIVLWFPSGERRL